MKNKKAQVTIFIIVAIVLVVALSIFFLARQSKPALNTGQEFNPETVIGECVRDAVRKNVDIMMPQGGVFMPTDYALFKDTKVAYICKNVNYYERCINQYPRYITFLTSEVKQRIEPEIEGCLNTLEAELKNKNYEVSLGAHSLDVQLEPGSINVNIPIDLTIQKNNVLQKFMIFNFALKNPLYDLGLVVNEITLQEAQRCYFEYVGYSLLYPDINVRVTTLSDSTKIYTLEHVKTGKEMNIAIRGCAIPAGF